MWVSHKKDWQGCQKFYLLFDWIVGIILANDYNFSKREYSAINSDGEPSVYLQKEWFLNFNTHWYKLSEQNTYYTFYMKGHVN